MTVDPRPRVPWRAVWTTAWRTIVALGIGGPLWAVRLAAARDYPDFLQLWVLLADPVIAVASLTLVFTVGARRPVVAAVGISALTLVSIASVGPAMLAAETAAERRQWRGILVSAVALTAGITFSGVLYPGWQRSDWWLSLVVVTLTVGIVVAIGVAVGQRRAVLDGLRERAAAAEREQQAREDAARAAERTRIAHDMHDVLAHRISLVALHATALSSRDDLSVADRTASVAAIAENARAALGELRDVLGVLRDPARADRPEPPQPGIDDIASLVAEGSAAGMSIELIAAVDGHPPLLSSQAAHRIVREALSNARKHAADAAVTVSLAGEPDDGLAVRVVNGPTAQDATDLPGSGLGLVGLAERVEAVGGRFEAGRTSGGGFAVSVWLPWAT